MRLPLRLSAWLFATLAVAPPVVAQVDLSVGVGAEGWRAAGSVMRSSPLMGGRIQVGGLLRATVYGGGARRYTDREEGTTGLPTTLMIAPAVLGVNVGVIVEVPVFRRARLGMNLDLVGVGLGPVRAVDSVRAHPRGFSIFRYGNADRGALNSEFYAAVRLSPRIEVRAGLSHYATGYRVAEGGVVGSYQRFDDALFVAIRAR